MEDELGYAGELTPSEAWAFLEREPRALLIDIRTDAEWVWVGFPDVSALGRALLYASWITHPTMKPNPEFLIEVSHLAEEDHDRPLLLICRSGVRSAAAAAALTRAGHTQVYNVSEGFEGDHDANVHRGTIGGWKVAGLPWKQK